MSSRRSKSKKKAAPAPPPIIYTCLTCGAAFYDQDKLKQHKAFHEDSSSQIDTSDQPSVDMGNQLAESNIPSTEIAPLNLSSQKKDTTLLNLSSPNKDVTPPNMDTLSPDYDSSSSLSKKLPILCRHPLCNTLCVDKESYDKHLLTHGAGASQGNHGNVQDGSNVASGNHDNIPDGSNLVRTKTSGVATRGIKRKKQRHASGNEECQKRKGGIAIGYIIQNKVADRKKQKVESLLRGASKELGTNAEHDSVQQVICPHCNIKMTAPMKICLAHMRSHTGATHTRSLLHPVVAMYKNNILSDHSKAKTLTFACTDCAATFASYEKLSLHAKSHVKQKSAVRSKVDAGKLQGCGLKSPNVTCQKDGRPVAGHIQQSKSILSEVLDLTRSKSSPKSVNAAASVVTTAMDSLKELSKLAEGVQNSAQLERTTGMQNSTDLQSSRVPPNSAGLQSSMKQPNTTQSQSSTLLQKSTPELQSSGKDQHFSASQSPAELQKSASETRSSTNSQHSAVSNQPVEVDLDEVVEIKQKTQPTEPSPTQVTSPDYRAREITSRPHRKVFMCHDLSCTFKSYSAWEYNVHIKNIHPLPADKSSTSPRSPVVLNIPDVSRRISQTTTPTNLRAYLQGDSPRSSSQAGAVEEPHQTAYGDAKSGTGPSGAILLRCKVCQTGFSDYDTFYKSHMSRIETQGWRSTTHAKSSNQYDATKAVLLACIHCKQANFPAYYLYMNHMQHHMTGFKSPDLASTSYMQHHKSKVTNQPGFDTRVKSPDLAPTYMQHYKSTVTNQPGSNTGLKSPDSASTSPVAKKHSSSKPYNPLRCSHCNKRCFTMTDYHKHEKLCQKYAQRQEADNKFPDAVALETTQEKHNFDDVSICAQPESSQSVIYSWTSDSVSREKRFCKPCKVSYFYNPNEYYQHMTTQNHVANSNSYYQEKLLALRSNLAPSQTPLFDKPQDCTPCSFSFRRVDMYFEHMCSKGHNVRSMNYLSLPLPNQRSTSGRAKTVREQLDCARYPEPGSTGTPYLTFKELLNSSPSEGSNAEKNFEECDEWSATDSKSKSFGQMQVIQNKEKLSSSILLASAVTVPSRGQQMTISTRTSESQPKGVSLASAVISPSVSQDIVQESSKLGNQPAGESVATATSAMPKNPTSAVTQTSLNDNVTNASAAAAAVTSAAAATSAQRSGLVDMLDSIDALRGFSSTGKRTSDLQASQIQTPLASPSSLSSSVSGVTSSSVSNAAREKNSDTTKLPPPTSLVSGIRKEPVRPLRPFSRFYANIWLMVKDKVIPTHDVGQFVKQRWEELEKEKKVQLQKDYQKLMLVYNEEMRSYQKYLDSYRPQSYASASVSWMMTGKTTGRPPTVRKQLDNIRNSADESILTNQKKDNVGDVEEVTVSDKKAVDDANKSSAAEMEVGGVGDSQAIVEKSVEESSKRNSVGVANASAGVKEILPTQVSFGKLVERAVDKHFNGEPAVATKNAKSGAGSNQTSNDDGSKSGEIQTLKSATSDENDAGKDADSVDISQAISEGCMEVNEPTNQNVEPHQDRNQPANQEQQIPAQKQIDTGDSRGSINPSEKESSSTSGVFEKVDDVSAISSTNKTSGEAEDNKTSEGASHGTLSIPHDNESAGDKVAEGTGDKAADADLATSKPVSGDSQLMETTDSAPGQEVSDASATGNVSEIPNDKAVIAELKSDVTNANASEKVPEIPNDKVATAELDASEQIDTDSAPSQEVSDANAAGKVPEIPNDKVATAELDALEQIDTNSAPSQEVSDADAAGKVPEIPNDKSVTAEAEPATSEPKSDILQQMDTDSTPTDAQPAETATVATENITKMTGNKEALSRAPAALEQMSDGAQLIETASSATSDKVPEGTSDKVVSSGPLVAELASPVSQLTESDSITAKVVSQRGHATTASNVAPEDGNDVVNSKQLPFLSQMISDTPDPRLALPEIMPDPSQLMETVSKGVKKVAELMKTAAEASEEATASKTSPGSVESQSDDTSTTNAAEATLSKRNTESARQSSTLETTEISATESPVITNTNVTPSASDGTESSVPETDRAMEKAGESSKVTAAKTVPAGESPDVTNTVVTPLEISAPDEIVLSVPDSGKDTEKVGESSKIATTESLPAGESPGVTNASDGRSENSSKETGTVDKESSMVANANVTSMKTSACDGRTEDSSNKTTSVDKESSTVTSVNASAIDTTATDSSKDTGGTDTESDGAYWQSPSETASANVTSTASDGRREDSSKETRRTDKETTVGVGGQSPSETGDTAGASGEDRENVLTSEMEVDVNGRTEESSKDTRRTDKESDGTEGQSPSETASADATAIEPTATDGRTTLCSKDTRGSDNESDGAKGKSASEAGDTAGDEEDAREDVMTNEMEVDDDAIPLEEPEKDAAPVEVIDLTDDTETINQIQNAATDYTAARWNDLREPPPPLEPFKLFHREVYLGVQQENEELRYEDCKKIIKNMWRVLPREEQQIYMTQYDNAVAEYNRQLGVINNRLKWRRQDQYKAAASQQVSSTTLTSLHNFVSNSTGTPRQVAGGKVMPTKPQAPLTPFERYCRSGVVKRIVEAQRGLNELDLKRYVRQCWQNLTVREKEPFYHNYRSEKLRYDNACQQYEIDYRNWMQRHSRSQSTTSSASHSRHIDSFPKIQLPGSVEDSRPSSSRRSKKNKSDKPITPYMRFNKKVYGEIKKKHPDLEFGALGKLMGQLWRELPAEEAEVYKKEYEKEKAEYERNKAEVERLRAMAEEMARRQQQALYEGPKQREQELARIQQQALYAGGSWRQYYPRHNVPENVNLTHPDVSVKGQRIVVTQNVQMGSPVSSVQMMSPVSPVQMMSPIGPVQHMPQSENLDAIQTIPSYPAPPAAAPIRLPATPRVLVQRENHTGDLTGDEYRGTQVINFEDSTEEEALAQMQKLFWVIGDVRPTGDVVHRGSDSFKCGFCGLILHNEQLFQTHTKQHSDEQANTCPLCRRHFTDQKALQQHSATCGQNLPSVSNIDTSTVSNLEEITILNAKLGTDDEDGERKQFIYMDRSKLYSGSGSGYLCIFCFKMVGVEDLEIHQKGCGIVIDMNNSSDPNVSVYLDLDDGSEEDDDDDEEADDDYGADDDDDGVSRWEVASGSSNTLFPVKYISGKSEDAAMPGLDSTGEISHKSIVVHQVSALKKAINPQTKEVDRNESVPHQQESMGSIPQALEPGVTAQDLEKLTQAIEVASVGKNRSLKCEFCKRTFSHVKASQFLKHIGSCSKSEAHCPYCDTTLSFPNFTEMKMHLATCEVKEPVMLRHRLAGRINTCHVCDSCFATEHLLKQHMKSHEADGSLRVGRINACLACDTCFATENLLVEHVKGHALHELMGRKKEKDASSKKQMIIQEPCPHCRIRIVYTDRKFYSQHVSNCCGPTYCPCCKSEYCFRTNLEYKLHLATCAGVDKPGVVSRVHRWSPSLYCHHCGGHFMNQSDLESHVESYGIEELRKRTDICIICFKAVYYTDRKEFVKHKEDCKKAKDMKEKLNMILCPYCAKEQTYHSQHDVKLHLATCDGYGNQNRREYITLDCLYCRKTFNDQQEFSSHVVHHTVQGLLKRGEYNKSFLVKPLDATSDSASQGESKMSGAASPKGNNNNGDSVDDLKGVTRVETGGYQRLKLDCPHCNLTMYFNGELDLKMHLATCIDQTTRIKMYKSQSEKSINVCEYCNLNLTTRDGLEKHVARHDLKSLLKIFVCNECGQKFRFEKGFVSHRRVHNNVPFAQSSMATKVQQQNVSPVTKTKSPVLMMDSPVVSAMGTKGQQQSVSPVTKSPVLMMERPMVSELTMLCPHCDTDIKYENDLELKLHLATCTAMNDQRKNKSALHKAAYGVCEICAQFSLTWEAMCAHVYTHTMHELLSCKMCVSCNQRFRHEDELARHRETAHGFQVYPGKAHHVACPHCDMEVYYNDDSELRMHLATCINKSPELLLGLACSRDDRVVYQCQYCLAVKVVSKFSSYEGLKEHIQRHTMTVLLKVQACPICKSNFRTKTQLTDHTKKWNGRCQAEMEIIMKSLSRDRLSVEDGVVVGKPPVTPCAQERSMMCPHCQREFKYRLIDDLQFHLATCTRGGMENCVCQVCGGLFAKRQDMWEHTRSHFLRNLMSPRNYTITPENRHQYIDRVTQRIPKPVVRPVRPDSGEKDYYHKDKPTTAASATAQVKNCKYCNAAFTNMKRNTEHPHQCRICHITIMSSPDLREHERSHLSTHICVKCPICHSRHGTQERLSQHVLCHIKSYSRDEDELICQVCDFRESVSVAVVFVLHVMSHQMEGSNWSAQDSGSSKDSRMESQLAKAVGEKLDDVSGVEKLDNLSDMKIKIEKPDLEEQHMDCHLASNDDTIKSKANAKINDDMGAKNSEHSTNSLSSKSKSSDKVGGSTADDNQIKSSDVSGRSEIEKTNERNQLHANESEGHLADKDSEQLNISIPNKAGSDISKAFTSIPEDGATSGGIKDSCKDTESSKATDGKVSHSATILDTSEKAIPERKSSGCKVSDTSACNVSIMDAILEQVENSTKSTGNLHHTSVASKTSSSDVTKSSRVENEASDCDSSNSGKTSDVERNVSTEPACYVSDDNIHASSIPPSSACIGSSTTSEECVDSRKANIDECYQNKSSDPRSLQKGPGDEAEQVETTTKVDKDMAAKPSVETNKALSRCAVGTESTSKMDLEDSGHSVKEVLAVESTTVATVGKESTSPMEISAQDDIESKPENVPKLNDKRIVELDKSVMNIPESNNPALKDHKEGNTIEEESNNNTGVEKITGQKRQREETEEDPDEISSKKIKKTDDVMKVRGSSEIAATAGLEEQHKQSDKDQENMGGEQSKLGDEIMDTTGPGENTLDGEVVRMDDGEVENVGKSQNSKDAGRKETDSESDGKKKMKTKEVDGEKNDMVESESTEKKEGDAHGTSGKRTDIRNASDSTPVGQEVGEVPKGKTPTLAALLMCPLKIKEEPISDDENDGGRKTKSRYDGNGSQLQMLAQFVNGQSLPATSTAGGSGARGGMGAGGRLVTETGGCQPLSGGVNKVKVHDAMPVCLFCHMRHDIKYDCTKRKKQFICPFCNKTHRVDVRCNSMVTYLSQYDPMRKKDPVDTWQRQISGQLLTKQEAPSTSLEFYQSKMHTAALMHSTGQSTKIPSSMRGGQPSPNQVPSTGTPSMFAAQSQVAHSSLRPRTSVEENLDEITIVSGSNVVSESHYKVVQRSIAFAGELKRDQGISTDINGIVECSKWDAAVVYDDPESDKVLGDIRCPFCYEKHGRPYVCLQTMVYLATFGKFEPLKMGDAQRARFMCPICYEDFPWDYNCRAHTFSRHVKNLQNSDVSISVKTGPIPMKVSEDKFACPICEQTFHSHQGCRSHLKVCDGSSTGRKKSSMTPFKSDKPRYRCPFCPEVHTRPYNCRYHVQKQHTCCEKPDGPNEPVKLAHERYMCPFCSGEFPRESLCKRHIAKAHLSKDQIVCGQCNQTYSRQEDHWCLALPIREKMGQYRCPYCPHKFFTRCYNCTAHIKEKHSGAQADQILHGPPEREGGASSSFISSLMSQNMDYSYDESLLEQAAVRGKQDAGKLKEEDGKYVACKTCGVDYKGQTHNCVQSKCPHCMKFFQLRSELLKHIFADHKLQVSEDVEDEQESGSPKVEMEELMAAADYYGRRDAEDNVKQSGGNATEASGEGAEAKVMSSPSDEVIIEDPDPDPKLPAIGSVYSQSESGSRDGSSYQDGSLADDEDDGCHDNGDESTGEDSFLDDLTSSSSPPARRSLILTSEDSNSQADSLSLHTNSHAGSKSVDTNKVVTVELREIKQMMEEIQGQEPVIKKVEKELQEMAGVYKDLEDCDDDVLSVETSPIKEQIGKVAMDAVKAAKELMVMYKARREISGVELENDMPLSERKDQEKQSEGDGVGSKGNELDTGALTTASPHAETSPPVIFTSADNNKQGQAKNSAKESDRIYIDISTSDHVDVGQEVPVICTSDDDVGDHVGQGKTSTPVCETCGVAYRGQTHSCLQSKCPHCMKRFLLKSDLLKHIMDDHKLKIEDDVKLMEGEKEVSRGCSSEVSSTPSAVHSCDADSMHERLDAVSDNEKSSLVIVESTYSSQNTKDIASPGTPGIRLLHNPASMKQHVDPLCKPSPPNKHGKSHTKRKASHVIQPFCVKHHSEGQASTSSCHDDDPSEHFSDFVSDFYNDYVAKNALDADDVEEICAKRQYGKTTSLDLEGGVIKLTMEERDSRHRVRVDKEGAMKARVWCPESYQDDGVPNSPENKKRRRTCYKEVLLSHKKVRNKLWTPPSYMYDNSGTNDADASTSCDMSGENVADVDSGAEFGRPNQESTTKSTALGKLLYGEEKAGGSRD